MIVHPATGEVLCTVGIANAADVAKATAAAAIAQARWVMVHPREKAEIFRRAATLFQQHFDTLSLFVARETGGILPKGQHEIREAALLCNLAAGMPLQAQGQELPSQHGRTSLARVWAGGDCRAGGRDLTVEAVEHGKLAALSIHEALSVPVALVA